MNTVPCRREEELDEAIRMDRWPEGAPSDLREHVAQCPSCGELSLIAEYLRQVGKLSQSDAVLPNADYVWWKARLAARRAAAERAARPVLIAQRVGMVAGALAAGGFAAWQWPFLKDVVTFSDSSLSLPSHSPTLLALLAFSLAGTLIAAGLGLYLIWSER